MIAPLPQHMEALNRANATYRSRCAMKREIARGERSVADVIRECPEIAETMTLTELLSAQHRWGANRSRRFLNTVALGEYKTVGSLTQRQRDLLAGML